MVEKSHPWDKDAAAGDIGPYGIPEYSDYLRANSQLYKDDLNAGTFTPTYGGVKPGYEGDLQVIPTTPASANVTILPGAAWIYGWDYENTANVTQAITANASGSTRYDVIGLAATNASQTVRLFYRTGSTTQPPLLTQNPGTLIEIPIAFIEVPNGFATISQDDIFNVPNLAYQSRTISMSVNVSTPLASPGILPGSICYWTPTLEREIFSNGATLSSENVYAGILEGGYSDANRGNGFRIVTNGFTPVRFKSGETPAVNDGIVPDFAGDMAYAVVTDKDDPASIGSVVSTDGYPTEMPLCYVNIPPKVASEDALILIVEDQKAANTAGGGSAAAGYQQRDLNTITYNSLTAGSVAGNELTGLPFGTYLVEVSAPGYKCGAHRIKIQSAPPPGSVWTDVFVGSSEVSAAADATQTQSVAVGVITLSSPNNYLRIYHYTTTAQATNGLGFPINDGDVEVYSRIKLTKIK